MDVFAHLFGLTGLIARELSTFKPLFELRIILRDPQFVRRGQFVGICNIVCITYCIYDNLVHTSKQTDGHPGKSLNLENNFSQWCESPLLIMTTSPHLVLPVFFARSPVKPQQPPPLPPVTYQQLSSPHSTPVTAIVGCQFRRQTPIISL